MRFALLALIAALVSSTAAAREPLFQGNPASIGGRAHVVRIAAGINILLDNGRTGSIHGFVPFDYKSTFPDLYQMDGHNVLITGLMTGGYRIILTDRNQIEVVD